MKVHAHTARQSSDHTVPTWCYIPPSHTALSQEAAPYLYVVYRVSRLAQDSPFAGSAANLVGWRHKASQRPVESGSLALAAFLLASIRTDPCRRLRLGPSRYRAHGLMLLLPFILPPSRRDARTPPSSLVANLRPRQDV